MIIYKLILFISIAIGIAGQLVLKHGMNRHVTKHGKASISHGTILSDLWRIYFNKWVIIGCIFYAASLPLWLMALSRLDLSYAYPLVSVNFVAITLLSKFLFHEKVTRFRWLSIFTIMAGVILLTMS